MSRWYGNETRGRQHEHEHKHESTPGPPWQQHSISIRIHARIQLSSCALTRS
jgi:hypothetical protein